jgi:hypothetical protein
MSQAVFAIAISVEVPVPAESLLGGGAASRFRLPLMFASAEASDQLFLNTRHLL